MQMNYYERINPIKRYIREHFAMRPQEIRTLPDMKVLYARASEVMTGPAFQTANLEAFNKLMGYVMANHSMALEYL
jgi:hypothetical protein